MKIYLLKLKSNFFNLFIIITLSVQFNLALAARGPVAQATQLSGSVFLVNTKGNTSSLKLNDFVDEKSEILVGESGHVTLNDYYDATYHLTSGSHLKFFNKSVQLKKGKAWVQSLNSRHPLSLNTGNSNVDFDKGEFIVTFDQSSAKTQVLVVNGTVNVSNILDKDQKYSVAAGMFTMLDPEIENGIPRAPTSIGLNSLQKSLAEFKNLPDGIKVADGETVSLPPTSTEVSETRSKGAIVFMKNGKNLNRLPASESSAHKYLKTALAIKKSRKNQGTIPVHFYGFEKTDLKTALKTQLKTRQHIAMAKKPENASTLRTPASRIQSHSEFDESLKQQQLIQPTHTSELESLMKDLKSF